MAEILWPAELPQVLILDNLSAEKQNNVIRTQMDAGPQKIRRRYTVATKNFSGQIVVTEAQRRVLEDWYDNDLASGALRFLMKDPQTLILSQFRFREHYKEDSLNGVWKITLSLEKMNA